MFDTPKRALITGASSGLGVEFARQLAPHAHALVLTARRQDRLEFLKAELSRSNPNLSIFCYALDLADMDALDRFTRWLSDEGIRINFLINNAGLGDHSLFQASEWRRVKAMLDVNIAALTRLTHAMLPVLRTFEDSPVEKLAAAYDLLVLDHPCVRKAARSGVEARRA